MNLAIVEGHALTRDVFRKICAEELGFTVILETPSGSIAANQLPILRPEFIIVDVELTDVDGINLITQLRQHAEYLPRILAVTAHPSHYLVYRLEHAAIDGFLDIRTTNVRELKEGIDKFTSGISSFSRIFSELHVARLKDRHSFDKLLSDREMVILESIADLLTDDQIASRYKISIRTVAGHRFSIMKKLNLTSKSALLRFTREHGFMRAG